ncbi:MAG: transketolase [Akkermansia muciniphila]|nr:transketolase [Akkermansia muciniphila]
MNVEILQKAANEARGLAIDAIFDKASGHMGLPVGCAEIGAVLYGDMLKVNPSEPRWLNRDRFILSGGHGSMFLYAWLHLAGFPLSMDDLKAFRSKGSKTPGHPEFNPAIGVECTTGPLGQGIANAVGFAISAKHAAARFNTPEHEIFNQTIYCLAGDGCIEEGISREAAAIAGTLKLDNLVLIYDANGITLDAPIEVTQIDDIAACFTAQGWDAFTIDGNDLEQVSDVLSVCRLEKNGRPKIVIAKTVIAKGVPGVEGTTKGHGEGGAKAWAEAHANWGLPTDTRYYVSDEVRAYMAGLKAEREASYAEWLAVYEDWRRAYPEKAAELDGGVALAADGVTPEVCSALIPPFAEGTKLATRASGSVAENAIADAYAGFLSTSADLFSSNKNYLNNGGDFSADNYKGRNFWFGIREHAMAAICNGIAYDGLFRVSAGTFCVFVDYMRAAIRVAALAHLPVTYVLTHDSVAVGEDGPTHQPVETVTGLRIIPNLDVVRPADEEETAGAWMCAMERRNGPTALILTRQNVPSLTSVTPELTAEQRRNGTLKGAYIARREKTEQPSRIIIASGSELILALQAANFLGDDVRVVSMPSMWRFNNQPAEYREEVLPSSCQRRVAIEAGKSDLWYRYVGPQGAIVSIDDFGFSAPGARVLSDLGMNVDNLINAARSI